MKTTTVHTRVTPEIKASADKIFASLGLTTSQAINLFLNAVVNKRGFPFELTLPDDVDKEVQFAINVGMVDGIEPPESAKKIMKLYAAGDIDYETAQFAIKRIYK